MQVEDPVERGGAEERQLRRSHEAQGTGPKAHGEMNDIFSLFYPRALSVMPLPIKFHTPQNLSLRSQG